MNILNLRKDKYIFGRVGLYFWGETDILLEIWGGKILLGSRPNYFQELGEINALFSGIKGAQTPWGASRRIRVNRSTSWLYKSSILYLGHV